MAGMATEDEYRRAIGKRLCEYRTARGWSQEQAARAVDVSVSTWRAWETGRREPYAANWQRISETFNVPVAVLRELHDPEALEARLDGLEARLRAIEDRLGTDPPADG